MSPTADNRQISLAAESKDRFPFSVKEPEVYQGDFVVRTGENEDHWFVARKGDKWRFDIFRGAERRMTQLRSDKIYVIDHQRRVYWEMPEQRNPTGDPGNSGNSTREFFRGVEHREFDEVGREGSLVKYKVRESDPSAGDILIYIDTNSGMMVKQEFTSSRGQGDAAPVSYIYEIKNLKMDVEESIFDRPSGYKKIEAEKPRSLSRN